MNVVKLKQSTSTLCLVIGISMSMGLVATQAQAQSVICKYNGSTLPDSECNKYLSQIGAKPGPTCPALTGCYGGSSSSGGDSDDSDDDGGAGYRDTDGDGVGDTYTDSCSGYCSEERGEDIDNFYDRDASNDGGQDGDNGGSSSSSGSSRVICTHFFRQGMMSRELWRADLEFTFKHLSWTTVRGYQFWGIPSVYLMRKHPWTEKIFWPLAINRAEEIAYQLGMRDKPNYVGKLIRWTMEPLCFAIGLFVGEQDWKKVHADMDQKLA